MTRSGVTTGSLDDVQVRNAQLHLYGTPTDIDLLTSTRFTQVVAGETNATLRWAVQQTPSLDPVAWETVSDPIEWPGILTPTNGFFRLQEP